MIVVSKKGQVVHPFGVLQGPDEPIPITSMSCSYGIGVLPICRVGLAPELLNDIPKEQADDLFKVMVGDGAPDHTLFQGYVAGENGRVGGSDIEAGLTLIHPARDIDEMRISAPNLHPAGVHDFTYTFFGNSITPEKGGFMFDGQSYYKAGGGTLPRQIIDGLIDCLKYSSAQNLTAGTAFKVQGAEAAIALLQKIQPLGGTLGAATETTLAYWVDQWALRQAESSFTSMSSIWDTLTLIFSSFGMYLVCTPEGDVQVMADCAGLTAPLSNYLGPEYITGFDLNTSLTRNIKEVNMLSDNIRPNSETSETFSSSLITYPPPEKQAERGASMSISLPGWLNPIAVKADDSLATVQSAYAQSQFYIERSKFRTVAVSGPLAPKVKPGTTALITPYSSVKTFSKKGVDSLQKTYTGYCYQVNHLMDAKAKTLQTTFYFRNVSDTALGETVTKHPIFDDVVPFKWD